VKYKTRGQVSTRDNSSRNLSIYQEKENNLILSQDIIEKIKKLEQTKDFDRQNLTAEQEQQIEQLIPNEKVK